MPAEERIKREQAHCAWQEEEKGARMGRKILEIVSGVGAGDGKAEVVCRLSRELTRRGWSVTVATLEGKRGVAAKEAQASGVRMISFQANWPGAIFFSWNMLNGLRALAREAEIVHVHGSWTFPVWWGCRCAVKEHKMLIVSPHGSFDPVRLAYSAWKKRLVGWLDRWCLRHANFVQATAANEAEWMRAQGVAKPIVIPNGVELLGLKTENLKLKTGERERTVLFVGRRHPLKGLDLLEAAWERVKRPGWKLACVGPGLPGGVVEGEAKTRMLGSADCLVLPTRSENFGLVVAEALAVGTPVICTQGAPWAELEGPTENVKLKTENRGTGNVREEIERGRCGWWCEVSVEGIAKALAEMMELTDTERMKMGMNGRELIEKSYTWAHVAERWERVIEIGN